MHLPFATLAPALLLGVLISPGPPAQTTLLVPSQYPTIQSAVVAAIDGEWYSIPPSKDEVGKMDFNNYLAI